MTSHECCGVARELAVIIDGRFELRGGELVGEAHMTAGLNDLLVRWPGAVTLYARPMGTSPVNFSVTYGPTVTVRALPDWSGWGALIRAPAILKALAGRPKVACTLSVGPAVSQSVLLALHRIRRRQERHVYLVRSHPTESILSRRASGWFLRNVLGAYLRLWQWLIDGQDAIVVSHAMRAELDLKHAQVAPEVDWAEFDRLPEGGSGSRIVLFAGRLEAEKGADVFVSAARRLADSVDAEFVVAGSGSMRAELEAESAGTVRFVGSLAHEHLLNLMGEAAVVVVPSRTEAFGLVALEAAGCGAVVVHSGVGGLGEAVGWAGNALICHGEDPGVWSEAIMTALSMAGPPVGRPKSETLKIDMDWKSLAEILLL